MHVVHSTMQRRHRPQCEAKLNSEELRKGTQRKVALHQCGCTWEGVGAASAGPPALALHAGLCIAGGFIPEAGFIAWGVLQLNESLAEIHPPVCVRVWGWVGSRKRAGCATA